MGSKILDDLVTIATGIVGLAIIAVLVSSKAKTPDTIKAAGSAFSSIIGAAVKPVA